MRKQIEEILRQKSRRELEEIFLEQFPDLPEKLKDNLSSLPLDSLVSFLADAEEKIRTEVLKGKMLFIFIERGEDGNWLYCFGKKDKELFSLNQVVQLFGEDKEVREACLAIPNFLKEKDVQNLSKDEMEKLNGIKEKAARALKNFHPDLDPRFAGFQLADNDDGILIALETFNLHKFAKKADFRYALEQEEIPIALLNEILQTLPSD